MKKKTRGLIITSLLTFSTLSIQVLTGCSKHMKAPEATIPISLKNDDKKGKVTISDINGFTFTDKAPKNSDIYIKVENINEKYELKQVTVNKIILHYDEERKAYVYHVTEEAFEINVQYKTAIVYRRLNVDLSKNTSIKKVDVYLENQETPLKNDSKYFIEIGKKVGLKIDVLDSLRILKVKINDIEATYNNEKELFEFIMPEVDADLEIITIKAVDVTYDINEFVDVKYKNGDKLDNNLPTMLTIDATEEFVGTINEGYELDLDKTYVINKSTGRVMNENEVKITIRNNEFSLKILKVPNSKLSIRIYGKKPGLFKNEKFVGRWEASATFGVNSKPQLIIMENAHATFNPLPEVPSNVPGAGELIKENGLLQGTLTNDLRTYITTLLPLYDESGECYAVVGYFDTNGSITSVFVRNPQLEVTTASKYKFVDSKKSYLSINYNNGAKKTWVEVDGSSIKEVEVFNEDKNTIPTSLEENKIYYSKINNRFIEFKLNNGDILSAGIEQGTYLRESMDDLVLDGYGNYSQGSKQGKYKYYSKKSLLVLDSGTENAIKYTLNLETSTYVDYQKVINEFTGLIFEFRTVATQSLDPEIYRFEFIDDSTVFVNNGNRTQVNQECNFDYNEKTNLITLYIPLVCNGGNDRIVKAMFNESFTTLTFIEDSYLCSVGDLKNKVAKATGLNQVFKKDNDTLKVTEEGFSLNDGPVSKFDLYVAKDGNILLRNENISYKINMINKTFDVLAPGDCSWIFNKYFAVVYEDTESNPEYNIKYTINLKFGASLDEALPIFYVEKNPMSYEGSSDYGKMNFTNVTATFNPNNLYLTLNVKGQKLIAYLDDETKEIIFKNDIEVYRKKYLLKDIVVVEAIEPEKKEN